MIGRPRSEDGCIRADIPVVGLEGDVRERSAADSGRDRTDHVG